MQTKKAGLFSGKSILLAFFLSAFYLLLSYFLIGFKTDQLVLIAIFNSCFFISKVARRFIIGFSIFIVYWILFDYMKAFPNYHFNNVHIQDLYNAEKLLFGFNLNGTITTPNEYWLQHGNTFLDILTGIFYLCWIPVPLAFAAYLFFKNKRVFLHFSFTFVLVNMIGFIIYYIYPAAPPWYYQLNGANFIPCTLGNTAGLHKFDECFNIDVFHGLYSKSSNVFAAMPSLHSSYPLIVLYFGIKQKMVWMNLVFGLIAAGIWFAAVYTSHHYVIDVLAGIICAVTGIGIFEKILVQIPFFSKFLNFYEANI
jgi:hypothetical protein